MTVPAQRCQILDSIVRIVPVNMVDGQRNGLALPRIKVATITSVLEDPFSE